MLRLLSAHIFAFIVALPSAYLAQSSCAVPTEYTSSNLLENWSEVGGRYNNLGSIIAPENLNLTFKFRPTAIPSVKSSILRVFNSTQSGNKGGHMPSIYFNNGTTQLRICMDGPTGTPSCISGTEASGLTLPLNVESTVNLVVNGSSMLAHVNGTLVYTKKFGFNSPPISGFPVKVTAGDPAVIRTPGVLTYVSFNNNGTSVFQSPNLFTVLDYQELGYLTIPKNMNLTFKINPSSQGSWCGYWCSVLRFTNETEYDVDIPGSRLPSINFNAKNEGRTSLQICVDGQDFMNVCIEGHEVPLLTLPQNVLSTVSIVFYGPSMTIFINNDCVYTRTLPGLPLSGFDAYLYAGSPWVNPFIGTLPFISVSEACNGFIIPVTQNFNFSGINLLATSPGNYYYLDTVYVPENMNLTFTFFPKFIIPDWAGILRISNTWENQGHTGDRIPSIYFHPNSLSLQVCMDGMAGTYVDSCLSGGGSTLLLAINQLNTISLVINGLNMSLYINGSIRASRTLAGPALSKVWADVRAGNIYGKFASGELKLIEIGSANVVSKSYQSANLITSWHFKQLSTIIVPQDIKVTFSINPGNQSESWCEGYCSVLRITNNTGEDSGFSGDQVPAILLENSSTSLKICVDGFDFSNYCVSGQEDVLSTVEVSFYGNSLSVLLNSVWVYSSPLPGAVLYGFPAYFFVGDPFYKPAVAIIPSISVSSTTGPLSLPVAPKFIMCRNADFVNAASIRIANSSGPSVTPGSCQSSCLTFSNCSAAVFMSHYSDITLNRCILIAYINGSTIIRDSTTASNNCFKNSSFACDTYIRNDTVRTPFQTCPRNTTFCPNAANDGNNELAGPIIVPSGPSSQYLCEQKCHQFPECQTFTMMSKPSDPDTVICLLYNKTNAATPLAVDITSSIICVLNAYKCDTYIINSRAPGNTCGGLTNITNTAAAIGTRQLLEVPFTNTTTNITTFTGTINVTTNLKIPDNMILTFGIRPYQRGCASCGSWYSVLRYSNVTTNGSGTQKVGISFYQSSLSPRIVFDTFNPNTSVVSVAQGFPNGTLPELPLNVITNVIVKVDSVTFNVSVYYNSTMVGTRILPGAPVAGNATGYFVPGSWNSFLPAFSSIGGISMYDGTEGK